MRKILQGKAEIIPDKIKVFCSQTKTKNVEVGDWVSVKGRYKIDAGFIDVQRFGYVTSVGADHYFAEFPVSVEL